MFIANKIDKRYGLFALDIVDGSSAASDEVSR